MSRRDAELVIRAKDEAGKVVASITDALRFLADAQTDVASGSKNTASGLGQLRDALVSVEKAYGQIDTQADRATEAFGRQQASLAETREQYAAITGQLEAAKVALTALRATKAPDFVGPTNVPVLKATEAAYRDLVSQQSKLASSVDRQESALATSRSSLQQVASTANAVEAALRDAGDASEIAKLVEQAQAAERAQKALADAVDRTAASYREQAAAARMDAEAERFQANLNSTLGVRQAGPEFSSGLRARLMAEAEAAKDQAESLARLRAQISPLQVIQAKLNKDLDEAEDHFRAGRISAEELALAQKTLTANADKLAAAFGKQGVGGKNFFLGLRPYEMQNLSYQINDVFTQLGSGTPILQIFAQQSGQVVQLFPKLMEAIGKGAKDPRILALVVTLGLVAAALQRINALSQSTREFEGFLASTADGANYSAQALALVVRRLDEAGVSAEDAKKAIRAFVKEGLPQEQLVTFADAAKNLAKVTGIDLPEAANKLAPAFKGGYEAIAKLDDEYNFLEPSQRAYIKALFDAGEAEKARATTLNLLNNKFKDAAEQLKGPLTDAIKTAADAWRDFLDWLGHQDILKNTVGELKQMALFAKYLAEQLPGAKADGAAGGGGLPGGVRRIPDVRLTEPGANPQMAAVSDFLFGKEGLSFNKPKWAGGTGEGKIDVTADIAAIVRTVILEARAGDAQGQQDIAAVILNRMAASGKSGVATVTAPGQFEPVGAAGSETRKAWEAIAVSSTRFQEALANILPILEGKVADPTKGATLFVSPGGQAAKGRKMPNWADPKNMTLERGGHQFFKGGFPGGGGQGPGSKLDEKRGDDYIAQLREQLALIGEVTDKERVRQAGLKALREAQTAGQNDATANAAKELAENAELSRITQERTDQARQLQTELTGMTNAASAGAAGGTKDLVEKWAAVNRLVDDYLAKLDREERSALPGVANYEALRTQAEANRQSLTQMATMKWFEEQIALLQKRRADNLSDINNRIAAGITTQADGLAEIQASDTKLVGQMSNLATKAAEFADSLRTAEPNPQLETFIAQMKSLPNDLAAAANKAQATFYATQAANLSAQRDSLFGQLGTAQENGDGPQIEQLRVKIGEINTQLIAALTNAKNFWTAMGGPEAAAANAQIDATIDRIKNGGERFKVTAGQINDLIVDTAASGLDQWAEAIANGENAVKSLWNSFRQFSADFLRQIAMMILKQTILNALQNMGGGGGIGGKIAQAVTAVVKHGGGRAGSPTRTRSVSSDLFSQAARYHQGGLPGLKANEVAAILDKREEVITEDDPRHSLNGGQTPDVGGGRGAPMSVKIINAIDPADVISKALNTVEGERVVVNWLRANKDVIDSAS